MRDFNYCDVVAGAEIRNDVGGLVELDKVSLKSRKEIRRIYVVLRLIELVIHSLNLLLGQFSGHRLAAGHSGCDVVLTLVAYFGLWEYELGG